MGSTISLTRKQCEACTKLLYLERFEKDNEQLDGMAKVCKSCSQQMADMEFCDEIHTMIRTMDSTALKTLESLGSKGPTNAKQLAALPHAATLLEDIMNVWGGSEGFAQHLMAEYLAARPGSQLRHSTIKSVMSLVKFVSEQNYVTQPLETMSDEQLEAHYAERRQLLQSKLGVFDGNTVDPPASQSAG